MPRTPANDEPPWDELSRGSSDSDALPEEPFDEPFEEASREPARKPSEALGPLEEERPSRWPLLIAVIVLVVLLVGALVYYWTFYRVDGPPDFSPTAPSVAPPPAVPPPKGGDESLEIELPPLGASDALIRELVEEVSNHPRIAAWVAPDDLVRRFVTTVDNLSRGESPRTHLRHLAPETGFKVDDRGGEVVIDERGFQRYDRAVRVFTSLDTARAVELYRHLEPLFEEAYGELGNPYKFEEALDRAIDELLAVPVPEGDIEVERRVKNYRFADPELESSSPAAKHLLRMGPRNAREVQAKLLAFKTALALTRSEEGGGP